MKFSAQVLFTILFSSMGLTVTADQMFASKEDIVCQGVDFSECSEGETDFFAKTVEKTFNSIHMPDRYMMNTHWLGVGSSEGNGRRLQSGGHTGGNSGCSFCPNDDAFVKGDEDTLMGQHANWGRDLTEQLVESGFTCFAKAKNCVVNMKETPFVSASEKDEENKSSFDAAMRVQCQNVDWATLTPAEQHFASAKLMRAFNAAQDGKKTLRDIQWESNAAQIASLMDYMLGFSSKSRLGYFRGDLLGGDAEIDLGLWEMNFEALLAEGPYSALSHARQCQIEIDAATSV